MMLTTIITIRQQCSISGIVALRQYLETNKIISIFPPNNWESLAGEKVLAYHAAYCQTTQTPLGVKAFQWMVYLVWHWIHENCYCKISYIEDIKTLKQWKITTEKDLFAFCEKPIYPGFLTNWYLFEAIEIS